MKKKMLMTFAVIVSVAFLGDSINAATVNGFANGGFETPGVGTPAESWPSAAAGYTLSSDSHTGSFAAQLASPELNAAVILQNSIEQGGLPPLTPGDHPILTFQSKGFAGTTGNALFALRYLDQSGAILASSGNQFFQNLINPNTWTEISFDLGVVPAGADAAFIEFSQGIGPIDPGNGLLAGLVLIDNVNLSVVSAVPEPTSVAMLGLCGFGMIVRRRRR
ncbi:PEP-CTERM sorting domain-containing protein [Rubripirellula reticaptiva]|uniref:Ice-binding protein C-terminal domain-containing protein n=1 Tax=Rubripirellula reticaptiva TaxID=2528013 RepID=A0A5C6EP69_9BACT|nr:PEP-CTERM sorting domain-containing protein [Rubripirellula reticaptiva]TWU49159.1 hypothetical protein Poly59_37730 [Rubripirellula reticaptiva]